MFYTVINNASRFNSNTLRLNDVNSNGVTWLMDVQLVCFCNCMVTPVYPFSGAQKYIHTRKQKKEEVIYCFGLISNYVI